MLVPREGEAVAAQKQKAIAAAVAAPLPGPCACEAGWRHGRACCAGTGGVGLSQCVFGWHYDARLAAPALLRLCLASEKTKQLSSSHDDHWHQLPQERPGAPRSASNRAYDRPHTSFTTHLTALGRRTNPSNSSVQCASAEWGPSSNAASGSGVCTRRRRVTLRVVKAPGRPSGPPQAPPHTRLGGAAVKGNGHLEHDRQYS